MLGQQAIDLTKEPRKPTPQEQAIWDKFLDRFRALTRAFQAYESTAKVAYTFQVWSDKFSVPFVVYDQFDHSALREIENRYNILTRLLEGVLAQKYFTHFSGGDVTILAPKSMPFEEYQNDFYPTTREESLKGILVLAIVAGVALLAGAIAGIAIADWDIQLRDKKFRDKLLKADLEMMKKPKQLRDEWQAMKEQSLPLINRSNDLHKGSWLQRLTQTGAGGLGLGLGLGIVGILVAWALSQRKGR